MFKISKGLPHESPRAAAAVTAAAATAAATCDVTGFEFEDINNNTNN